jgi:hypothetical protein
MWSKLNKMRRKNFEKNAKLRKSRLISKYMNLMLFTKILLPFIHKVLLNFTKKIYIVIN